MRTAPAISRWVIVATYACLGLAMDALQVTNVVVWHQNAELECGQQRTNCIGCKFEASSVTWI